MPHGPDQFLLELFAIFVAAKVVGEIFERLRLPAVMGEILAGATLGPYALGWIHPSETLHSIAEIGAIFVLFYAGLETSPQDLIRVGRKALLVAVAGIVVPFALGFAYMKWRGDASTEAIFVGAAMVATSADAHVIRLKSFVSTAIRDKSNLPVIKPALSPQTPQALAHASPRRARSVFGCGSAMAGHWPKRCRQSDYLPFR